MAQAGDFLNLFANSRPGFMMRLLNRVCEYKFVDTLLFTTEEALPSLHKNGA